MLAADLDALAAEREASSYRPCQFLRKPRKPTVWLCQRDVARRPGDGACALELRFGAFVRSP